MIKSQIEQIKEILDNLGDDTLYGRLVKTAERLKNQQAQIESLYAEIGKMAYEQNPEAWPEQDRKLKTLFAVYAETTAYRDELGAQQRRALLELAKCKVCGYQNAEGKNFCENCGNELEIE